MPDRLPWSELLRRRNGLPATEPMPGAPINAEQYAALRAAGHQDGELATAAAVRQALAQRCPHTDLPTTMCHHCKETDHEQPA